MAYWLSIEITHSLPTPHYYFHWYILISWLIAAIISLFHWWLMPYITPLRHFRHYYWYFIIIIFAIAIIDTPLDIAMLFIERYTLFQIFRFRFAFISADISLPFHIAIDISFHCNIIYWYIDDDFFITLILLFHFHWYWLIFFRHFHYYIFASFELSLAIFASHSWLIYWFSPA